MSEFDFIVVGAGPAGASLASRLATSQPSLKVLLIEAGGTNSDPTKRFLFDRFSTFITSPEYNWNYMTVPQSHLNDKSIFYARGKGLGGSSAINFCCYTIGPKDDYDHWARLVDDSFFDWTNAQRRYSELESFHNPQDPEFAKHIKLAAWHGGKGPVGAEFPPQLEPSLPAFMDLIKDAGYQLNPDINSGNPIGIGIGASTAIKGMRVTSAAAFLEPPPSNLTVKTDAPIAKVFLDGKKAIGVETIHGDKYYSSKETILSAGTLDTPKILMLSGIGPKEELDRHKIPLQHELSGVGRNLTDHSHFMFSVEQKADADERSQLFSSSDTLVKAREQFAKDGTGAFSYINHTFAIGFLKDEKVLSSPEFAQLPSEVQEHLQRPTIPTYEFIGALPMNSFFTDDNMQKNIFGASAVLLNPQSRGTVTLASSNPADPPVCDPNFFSHPFDRLNIIQAARKVMEFFKIPKIATNIVNYVVYPKSESDEDIWETLKDALISTWHMTGTCKMGNQGDETAVVDSKFKVKGIEGLRVVDLSVLPLEPNCHTVTWAYLTGWTGAEAIIKEYGFA